MFKMKSLDHVVLRVANIDECIDFYEQVLGCTMEKEHKDLGLYQLRAGDFIIDLMDVDSPVGREGGGPPPASDGHNVDHFCIRIEPFDESQLRSHFRKFDVDVSTLLNNWGGDGRGPSVYVRDPAGNKVEVKGPPTEPYVP